MPYSPEERRAYQRAWRAAHPGYQKAYGKAWRAAHPDYQKTGSTFEPKKFASNVTKREIVESVSRSTRMDPDRVRKVIQRTLDLITNILAHGKSIELRNFGVFEVRITKGRVGRNPNQPGSDFKIPPRATVKFKAGKVMREKVSKLSPKTGRTNASESAADAEKMAA